MVTIEVNRWNRLILTEDNRTIEGRRYYRCDPFRIDIICYLGGYDEDNAKYITSGVLLGNRIGSNEH